MLMENLPIPHELQEEFESVATHMYGENDAARALTEAVEMWLSNQRERQINFERTINNQKFDDIKLELLQHPPERWFVIAHGQLQIWGDSIEEVDKAAPNAQHRIVMQVSEIQTQPKIMELGWQSSFASFDGILQTTL